MDVCTSVTPISILRSTPDTTNNLLGGSTTDTGLHLKMIDMWSKGWGGAEFFRAF